MRLNHILYLISINCLISINTVIPFVIFPPKKADFLSFFSWETWQRPTVWAININRDHFIFYWVFLDGRRKNSKAKSDTSFNWRLSVAKNSEGNMTTAKKNVKNFILQGNMAKGITVIFCILRKNFEVFY